MLEVSLIAAHACVIDRIAEVRDPEQEFAFSKIWVQKSALLRRQVDTR
jgi:hypothetical protein